MLRFPPGRTTPPPAEGRGRVRRARRAGVVPGGCAALALFAACPTAAVAAPDAREFALAAGAQRELLIDTAIERLAVADEAVASVLVTRRARGADGARLIVTGKAAGRTTLMVWRRGADAATTYEVVVRRPQGVVEGSVPSLEAHARRVQDARTSGAADAPLADRSVVAVRSQTVQVEVKIVEFNRSVLKEAGINLTTVGPNVRSGFSFINTTSTSLLQAFNLVLGLNNDDQTRSVGLALRLLQSNGLARVLAEPTLVATSGQSASFLSGGELPIPVPQGLGTVVITYKPFGIGLTVTPTVLSNDRIALKVAPEASDLDYTNALNLNGIPVPAITTRRADTAVELGDGESFVIGGLVSRSTLSNASKVPFLGDLPVIGLLFKQNNYRMNEKELVIVVTPHLVRPIARGTDLSQRLPGGAEQRDGNVWNRILLGDIAERDALPGFSR
ncbi:type II and III secretion system protein family protein [Variovorax sp. PvP013]|uniref:type II and III secretion system protein family protein n=1 Tax=Variovorax sp. PvP013 TaxID=3156435 RepID=UPI003D1D94CE